jgi:hypothetical protein
MPDLDVAPVTVDPSTDADLSEADASDHERMTHIVLEGFKPKKGDFVSAGPSVVEGIVNATAVQALCGKVWVPGRDPRRYPLCPTCKEIAQSMGWKVPAG